MELHSSSRLSPGFGSEASCERYLDRLPLSPERRRELLRQARNGGPDPRSSLVRLHQALAGLDVEPESAAYASTCCRLGLAFGAEPAHSESLAAKGQHGRLPPKTVPPLVRTPMAPEAWPPATVFRRSWWIKPWSTACGLRNTSREGEQGRPTQDPRGRWQLLAPLRGVLLLCLVLSQTAVATYFMAAVLPYHGGKLLEIAVLALYAVLFGWISIGFWTAAMGFLLLLLGGDRYAISRTAAGRGPIQAGARTAVVMPICNEDVRRVFAGLRATHKSLSQTGQLRHFDFFVLSDSSDPNLRVAEIESWMRLRQEMGEQGRIFYRWRPHRIKRKSGNIADFCRRWGSQYRYMVVLDADSVMTGDCLVALVRLMEANPDTGIIQTVPRAAGRDTLYARIQQFAACAYGPLFAAGLHFWQLGESYYWGHNAIIRVAPFIRHCALGRLRRRGTLSREILSHDFVEAALMRRAGWSVWLAYDLPGSYEEVPPNLAEELGRDRRWCKGNLINSRLLLAEGLRPAHRALFILGVMVYLSAPLWLLFLLLSTALLTVNTLVPPQYFVQLHQLFPLWPEWHPDLALRLLSATAVLLVLPKILSLVSILRMHGAARFGGKIRLAVSILMEFLFSALLAPIRMLVHTQFVLSALFGVSFRWTSPSRADAETTWGDALQRHGLHTLLGVLWAAGVYSLNPTFLWWLLPVVGALVLSVPVSVYSSRVSLGRRLRSARLFMTPEESWPPKELRWTRDALKRPAPPGFAEAVVDPVTNALVCAYGKARIRQSATIRERRTQLVEEALQHGPASLSNQQKMTLLSDALALSQLHLELWSSRTAHPSWGAGQVRTLATPIARRPPGRSRTRAGSLEGSRTTPDNSQECGTSLKF